MIDQDAIDRYFSKGWTVVEDVFDRSFVERGAAAVMEIATEEMDNASMEHLRDRSADGSVAPRKINDAFLKHSTFRKLALDSRLVAIVEKLLGAPPLMARDQVFLKPPHLGSAKPYHQDNFYFQCSPADQVLTAWIALDDADEDNGCLRYIDGSQKQLLPHEPVPGESHNLVPPPHLIDLSAESVAPVAAGGVVLHHSQCLHTSGPNDSERWRRGYATHWVTAAVVSSSTILERAYYKRSDYG